MNKYVLAVCLVAPAVLTASTVYVSGNGSDANNCSEGAPCRTFAHAMLSAGIGGTVVALDSGDFSNGGTLSMHFPVTLDGGAHGAFLSGPNGAAAIDLSLSGYSQPTTIRNISILTGVGDNASAISGYVTGTVLNLEKVTVSTTDRTNFVNGIQIQLDSAAQTNFKDVSVTGGLTCVNLYPYVSSGNPPFNASLENVTASGCLSTALQVQAGNVTVRHSTFRDSFNGVLFILPAQPANALFEQTQITNNSVGFSGSAPYTVRLSNSVVSGNTTGIQGSATYISFRNNTFAGNGTDGPITLSTSLK